LFDSSHIKKRAGGGRENHAQGSAIGGGGAEVSGRHVQRLTTGSGLSGSSGTERLLPGEPVDSDQFDEVQHWVIVYEELTAFVRQAERDLSQMLNRYARRLEHWRRRHDELAGPLRAGEHRNRRPR
jgi:ADP-ribose pyrophosphatase YjhB (NUDIX family)